MLFILIANAVESVNTEYESLWLSVHKPSPRLAWLTQHVGLVECQFSEAIKREIALVCTDLNTTMAKYTQPSDKAARLVFLHSTDASLGTEGYTITNKGRKVIIAAYGDAGWLYGLYHMLRLAATNHTLRKLNVREVPFFESRQLNHWDDLNGNIERGYAGRSLWQWDQLPSVISQRYIHYARACASVGLNGVVLNNVNADPRILRSDYLRKVAALADVLREYNIKVFLAINFAAPMKPSDTPDVMRKWGGIGTLTSADPCLPEVEQWWKQKADEIYKLIPDFGGFLVKANSEGMPGPQDYGRSHADGANMLARALKPHGGRVIWRTFVYNAHSDPDRLKRPYKEFMPLDGKFDQAVILQAKNGALDFQPMEPPQPLFCSMKHTPLMLEVQITQEYLGQSVYLVDLLPMWQAFLQSPVARRWLEDTDCPWIAGVANTGSDPNWTGHDFAQFNWYAFGRMAWQPFIDAHTVRQEWICQTWHTDKASQQVIEQMMEGSWRAFVSSQTPYALGMTVRRNGHLKAGFTERVPEYFSIGPSGIGTDRTCHGTGYAQQYPDSLANIFNNENTCPEDVLLCFHHLPWTYKMSSGKTLREAFLEGLHAGVEKAERNIKLWQGLSGKIDHNRHARVAKLLEVELYEAQLYYESAMKFYEQKVK